MIPRWSRIHRIDQRAQFDVLDGWPNEMTNTRGQKMIKFMSNTREVRFVYLNILKFEKSEIYLQVFCPSREIYHEK